MWMWDELLVVGKRFIQSIGSWRARQFCAQVVAANVIVVSAITPTFAAQTTADSVSENFTPARTVNFACSTNVGVTSNGSFANNDGYCPLSSVPSNYEISYDFSLGLDERMTSIIIWANSGGIYTDGELQSFDLEVDYINASGVPSTLVMSGVNIGDTLGPADPRTVLFQDGGSTVELRGVSQIRLSNLGGTNPEFAFRELVGDVFPDAPVPDLDVVKTAAPNLNVTAGTLVTYTYVVTNTGNQPINSITLNDIHNGTGTPPTPGNEILSGDNGFSGDSSDTVTNDGVWDVLSPFDVVTFTATYVVTQEDIDTLQ